MSRTITISVPHSLGQQMALERVTSLCNQIRAQYADRMKVTKEVWTGNRLDFAIEALTRTVSGAIDVEDNAVAIAVDLPFLLWPLASKAKALIERRAKAILQPA